MYKQINNNKFSSFFIFYLFMFIEFDVFFIVDVDKVANTFVIKYLKISSTVFKENETTINFDRRLLK